MALRRLALLRALPQVLPAARRRAAGLRGTEDDALAARNDASHRGLSRTAPMGAVVVGGVCCNRAAGPIDRVRRSARAQPPGRPTAVITRFRAGGPAALVPRAV